MEYSEDFLAGWAAARDQYQRNGSVLPFPPGFSPPQSEAEAGDPAAGASPQATPPPPPPPPDPATIGDQQAE